jgi:hypothetical protein
MEMPRPTATRLSGDARRSASWPTRGLKPAAWQAANVSAYKLGPWYYARQAPGRTGRAEEGRRHRGAQHLGPATMVEAAGMVAVRTAPLQADRLVGLSRGVYVSDRAVTG